MLDAEFESLGLHHLAVGDVGLDRRRFAYFVINEGHPFGLRGVLIACEKNGVVEIEVTIP